MDWMNDRLQNDEALFEAARRLTNPAQRAAFLDAACAGDAALRQRLDDFLAAQSDAEDFFRPLPKPVAGVASPSVADAPVTEGPGSVIDKYKLLEKLGE